MRIVRVFQQNVHDKPEHFRLVNSTEEVMAAVQEAVENNVRVVVRSGGHCLEGFVADPAVQLVIDTSLMTNIYHDEPCPPLLWKLVPPWEKCNTIISPMGVGLPAGEHPEIGAGGHIWRGFRLPLQEHGPFIRLPLCR